MKLDMTITREHFIHPQRAAERLDVEYHLKRHFSLTPEECYAAAGLKKPYLSDHTACALVLSEAFDLVKDLEDGRYQQSRDSNGSDGFMEELCSIESKADFLTELKSRLV